MAARTRKIKHDDFTRERIRVTQLINRLENHALGECGMEATQIKAIEILLRKALPDLSAVAHSGQIDGKTELTVVTGVPRAD